MGLSLCMQAMAIASVGATEHTSITEARLLGRHRVGHDHTPKIEVPYSVDGVVDQ